MSLDFARLRAATLQRQAEWDESNQITPLYRAVELGGEVGELLNVIKKLEREKLGIRGSRATPEALRQELADVVICADLLAAAYGVNLGDVVVRKFNKTSEANGLGTRL